MIWLTWRQYRMEALISVLLLILLAILFVDDGLGLYSAYQSAGLASCSAYPCNDLTTHAFRSNISLSGTYNITSIIANCLPLLALFVGVFIGAPLVAREQDQQTHYLLWTQSITRTHWLTIKLSLIVGAVLIFFVALTMLITWWVEPLSKTTDPWMLYDARGLVLPGFALFSLLLGVTVGTFLRKAVSAMGLTFLILLFVFVILQSAYPYAVPPLTKIISNPNDQGSSWTKPGDWGLFSGYTDPEGHIIPHLSLYCNPHANGDYIGYIEEDKCVREHHLLWKIVYQPTERFWLLQEVVSAILLLLTAALVPVIFWRLRKRIN